MLPAPRPASRLLPRFQAPRGNDRVPPLGALVRDPHTRCGLDLEDGCIDGEAPVLPWQGDGLLDLESACGDGSFRFGFNYETRPERGGLYGMFAVEIPRAGPYDLTVSRAADDLTVYGALRRCDNATAEGVGSLDGRTGHGLFEAGRWKDKGRPAARSGHLP